MSIKTRPGVFDCYGAALPDEETFTVLARDAAAGDTVRHWAGKRVGMGLNKPDDPQIREALQCANRMDEQHGPLRQYLAKIRGAATPLSGPPHQKPPPFANCKFEHCDLPGQCISEGKCHHPKEPTDG